MFTIFIGAGHCVSCNQQTTNLPGDFGWKHSGHCSIKSFLLSDPQTTWLICPSLHEGVQQTLSLKEKHFKVHNIKRGWKGKVEYAIYSTNKSVPSLGVNCCKHHMQVNRPIVRVQTQIALPWAQYHANLRCYKEVIGNTLWLSFSYIKLTQFNFVTLCSFNKGQFCENWLMNTRNNKKKKREQ